MDEILDLAIQRLKNKHNIQIDKKTLKSYYVDFIKQCLIIKKVNLSRDVYLPEFGTIKISIKRLKGLVHYLFKKRDPEIYKYLKELRKIKTQRQKIKTHKYDN